MCFCGAIFIIFLAMFVNSATGHDNRMLRIPENPCPQVFQYKKDPQMNFVYGEISIPYDGSKNLEIQVNVSLAGFFHGLSVPIEMITRDNQIQTSRYIQYRLNFPFSNLLPKITQIKYNDRIYCYGPPEPLTVTGITNLWSKLTYRIVEYTIQVKPPGGLNNEVNPCENIQNPFLHCKTETRTTPQSIVETPTSPPPLKMTQTPPQIDEDEDSSCGFPIDVRALVLKGANTEDIEFPWLVAMFFKLQLSYHFSCTANLISKRHVLTAGHCVRYHKALLVPQEDMLFVLGHHDLSHWATSGALIRTAMQISVHPEYRQGTAHGDLAVIKLNEDVPYRPTIKPVCLWPTSDTGDLKKVVGSTGTVAGWGKDESGSQTAPQPKKITMPIVSQEECLRSNTKFHNLTSDMTFCAGARDGAGPCSGDSGAGLVVNIAGRFFLRGLVSTAISEKNKLSCDLGEFVVFADAAKTRDWIQKCVKQ